MRRTPAPMLSVRARTSEKSTSCSWRSSAMREHIGRCPNPFTQLAQAPGPECRIRQRARGRVMNRHSVWSLGATASSLGGKEMGALARSLAVLAALAALALIAPIAATPAAGGPVRAGRRRGRRLLARGRLRRPVRRPTAASSGPTASTPPPTRTARTPRTGSSRASAPARSSSRAPTATASRSSRTTSTSRRTCSTGAPRSCSSRATPGITRANLTIAVTHDHSSPYYSSTSWGAWAFQDVYDVRFFDYYAKRMAEAVEQRRRRAGAGPDRRLGQHVRQDPPPLVRARGRRRRHAGRIPQRGDRPRPHRGALRRRVGPGQPEAAREPRQLQPPPRDAERQRPDLGRLRGADAAHGRPRDGRRSPSSPRTRSAPPSRSAAPTTRCTSGSSSRTASTRRPSTARA